MGTLFPSLPLIYERVNGVVYARYRDPPHNSVPRWEIGRDANSPVLGYDDFCRMQAIAQSHEGFKDAWGNLLTQYYLLKDIDTDKEKK